LVVLVCNECLEKGRKARYKADTWQRLGRGHGRTKLTACGRSLI
jgi:hypothetical protein